ncbi:MAG TPA: hypothetical protein VK138_06025 [Acidiferrobacterales bacterium]|nr:hypothetical protein [Acidiferrobacterales bacterium]
MKKTILFVRALLLLAFVILIGACSGKTTVKSDLGLSGAPDWVNEGTNILKDKNGRLFHGVGSAPPMGDMSLQKSTADERARAEVARILSSYMDVVSNDYTASTGNIGEAEQAVSRQIKNLTKINLTGAKIIGSWRDKKSNVIYSIAELDMQNVKATTQNVQDMNEGLRNYISAQADNIFDKISSKEGKK